MSANEQHAATDSYDWETGDPVRDRDAVLAVWDQNLGEPARQVSKFDWCYLNSPGGAPLLQLLRYAGEVIGTCAAMPRRLLWQGREIRAGLLVDMAVAARHRTLGPALLLQEALMAAAASRYDLLYGFPSPKSLPVVKRLGYTLLGEKPRFARVLRSAGYLQQYLPAWLATVAGAWLDAVMAGRDALRAIGARRLVANWAERADTRMDALWHASRPSRGLVGMRDSGTLRWRFDASPFASTRYLMLSERQDGPLQGWFACQVMDDALIVVDYWSEQGSAGIDHQLVLALVRAARRSGYSSISLRLAAPAACLAGWLRAGFVQREVQPVVGKWLGEGPAPADPAQDWFLTDADSDG